MKNTIRSVLAGVAALGLAASLTACGSNSDSKGADAGSAVTLKLAHVFPQDDPQAKAVSRFADAVEQKTNGSVTIQIFPAGQAGADVDILEGLGLGTTDMWYGGAGTYNTLSDVGQFFVTPFMFNSVDDMVKAYDGKLGDAVRSRLDGETDTHLIDLWARGPRDITSNKPLKTPADMSGLRIRVPENPMFIEGFKAMGASPTPMEFTEVYTALDQGTIDAQENPLALIKSSGFSKVQHYLNMTAHVIEPLALTISQKSWDALSKDQQDAIARASAEEGKRFHDEVNEQEAQLLQDLKDEGMTVVQPDIAAFRKATNSVRKGAGSEFSDLYSLLGD